MRNHNSITRSLKLRAGEIVEVRSRSEIFSTLDNKGTLDELPFMPEMLESCGKQYKVYKRADKTCDTIEKTGCRRMINTVHLDGVRCDGESHGNCDATCLLHWKEAWLRRVDERERNPMEDASGGPEEMEKAIQVATRRDMAGNIGDKEIFVCQATELRNASMKMAWWDIRQYMRDITSGNVGLRQFLKVVSLAWFNWIQRQRKGAGYPFLDESLLLRDKGTPSMALNLQPREFVKVRAIEEILPTLNQKYKNRGLWFDNEMAVYCGRTARVLKRVVRIINEKTGEMINLPNDCLILEGVICTGELTRLRFFCPRAMYPYWREIWLERIDGTVEIQST